MGGRGGGGGAGLKDNEARWEGWQDKGVFVCQRGQGEEGESLKSGCGRALLAACLVARVEENLQGDGRGCGRQGMFFCTLGVRGGCGIG